MPGSESRRMGQYVLALWSTKSTGAEESFHRLWPPRATVTSSKQSSLPGELASSGTFPVPSRSTSPSTTGIRNLPRNAFQLRELIQPTPPLCSSTKLDLFRRHLSHSSCSLEFPKLIPPTGLVAPASWPASALPPRMAATLRSPAILFLGQNHPQILAAKSACKTFRAFPHFAAPPPPPDIPTHRTFHRRGPKTRSVSSPARNIPRILSSCVGPPTVPLPVAGKM